VTFAIEVKHDRDSLARTEYQCVPASGLVHFLEMADVTRLLHSAANGDRNAGVELLPLVYDELRKLAATRMAAEQPGHTLQATALVHEAYLRLVGDNGPREWNGRGHFFAAAAEAMRRILVDSARRAAAEKRGGGHARVPLEDVEHIAESPDGLIALDDALSRLEELAPGRAQLVKLRFFSGLTMPEAAAALDISLATAERWWTYARSWLFAALGEGEKPTPP
jgi:RNA polymerase sigma factor (TIGR02999 family)